jgi:hypothetical protein
MDEPDKDNALAKLGSDEAAAPMLREVGEFVQAITPAIKEVGDKIILAAKENKEAMIHQADVHLDMHKATLDAERERNQAEIEARKTIAVESIKRMWWAAIIRNVVVGLSGLALLGIGFYCIYSEKIERGYTILICGVTLLTTMWSGKRAKDDN